MTESRLTEVFLEDRANSLANGTRFQPLCESARSPVTAERTSGISNQKSRAEIRIGRAHQVAFECRGQRFTIDVRFAPNQLPWIERTGFYLDAAPLCLRQLDATALPHA